MCTSEELLRDFAQSRSEEAFRQLVERHLDLVFATALRLSQGDRHFAQDVSQMVFGDLAQKAAELPRHTIVAGWLYRHASFTAAKLLRSARRRTAREQASTEDSSTNPNGELADRLEPALEKLGEMDRDALVLRFLEARNLREVGETLGISEDTAQKRVHRALDKLRAVLATQGFSISALALSSALEAQPAAAAAPAPGISQQILEQLPTQLIPSMNPAPFIKIKFAALGITAVAVGTGLFLQYREIQRLTADLAAEKVAKASETDPMRTVRLQELELEQLRRGNAELHKLRAEVTELRERFRQGEGSGHEDAKSAEPVEAIPPTQLQIDAQYAEVPIEVLQELQALGIPVPSDSSTSTLLTGAQTSQFKEHMRQREGVDFLSAPRLTTLNGRQAQISVEDTVTVNGEPFPVGQVLDVIPSVSLDRAATTLKLAATFTEFLGYSEPDQLPRFRVSKASSAGSIRGAESLLLRLNAHDNAETPEAARKLLLLVSSTLINPDGSLVSP